MSAKRTTILDAVVDVLHQANEPLGVAQIHQLIVERGLYKFGTKDEVGVVRSAIQRHLRASNAPVVARLNRNLYTSRARSSAP